MSTQTFVPSTSPDSRHSAAAPHPTAPDTIQVRGAEVHNLKAVDLDLPRARLIVFTGVSGSGKSSLAFDTLFAEGRRRYVESLSTWARQQLGQMDKPKVRSIKGLSPTIAIQQGQSSLSPRSTVGTLTELSDFLRLLYARVGVQHCHACGTVVRRQSAQEIVYHITHLPMGTKFTLLAPLETRSGSSLRDIFLDVRKRGFARVRVDGTIHPLETLPDLDARIPHSVDIVIDRLVMKEGLGSRLTDSIETALRQGNGVVTVLLSEGGEHTYTERLQCPTCATEVPEKTPQLFSFNSPIGMCPSCHGLGTTLEPDERRVIPDPGLSISQGAILPWAGAFERLEGATYSVISSALASLGIDVELPFRELTADEQQQVLHGADEVWVETDWSQEAAEADILPTAEAPRKKSTDSTKRRTRFEGAIPGVRRRLRETRSDDARKHLMEYVSHAPCPACQGLRLRTEALHVRVGEWSIGQLSQRPLREVVDFFERLSLPDSDAQVVDELLREVKSRLHFLLQVGLPYLSLDRAGSTLSGGEAQRIRLASQIGSELTGVLYVLDEPSVGLHPKDNARLLQTLTHLRDLGNTVLVVEHDPDTIAAAEFLVDFGPGAGPHGGEVLYAGHPAGVLNAPRSITGQYLSGKQQIQRSSPPRGPARHTLEIQGASEHNLKNIDVHIPLERLVAITGVSGAGKSTLIYELLYPALSNRLHRGHATVGQHRAIRGLERLDQVVMVDQAPIGRSARSIPATYVRLMDPLRRLYAQLPESKLRGYTEQRFSFNLKGGRCEGCQGEGIKRVDMAFLADVVLPCELCGGRRFNDATLEVKFKGLSIADMLERPIEELYPLLRHQPVLARSLFTLLEVGLGYLTLGQSATSLSGGESQRLKLARELARIDTGKTLYLLDEPTTGLHFDDTHRLLKVLERLVDTGNSVVLIEHNLELIACADHVIELGPEGGEGGGYLLAEGTPEMVARQGGTPTGDALRKTLAGNRSFAE